MVMIRTYVSFILVICNASLIFALKSNKNRAVTPTSSASTSKYSKDTTTKVLATSDPVIFV